MINSVDKDDVVGGRFGASGRVVPRRKRSPHRIKVGELRMKIQVSRTIAWDYDLQEIFWHEMDDEKLNAMKNWCKANLGQDRWNYYGVHKKTPCEFIFKTSEDLLAFKMRFVL